MLGNGRPFHRRKVKETSPLTRSRESSLLERSGRLHGKPLERLNDVVLDGKGNIYFSAGTAYYTSANGGEVRKVGDNIRSNGIIVSPDDKTLYVTNNAVILAFDIQPDGIVNNRREFVKLERGNGDGMAVDAAGRVYISTGAAGSQVFA